MVSVSPPGPSHSPATRHPPATVPPVPGPREGAVGLSEHATTNATNTKIRLFIVLPARAVGPAQLPRFGPPRPEPPHASAVVLAARPRAGVAGQPVLHQRPVA